jgi:transposase-like protein
MPESRRRFDPEFRGGAVQIVREAGKPVAQVARDLGIGAETLRNWVEKDKVERGESEGLSRDERQELAQLRREVAELWMERSSSEGWSSGDAVSLAGFIADQKAGHRVPYAVSCRALGVSQSWFHKWHDRPPTPAARRRAQVDAAVAAKFKASDSTYGSPRVHAELTGKGWRVSEEACRFWRGGRPGGRSARRRAGPAAAPSGAGRRVLRSARRWPGRWPARCAARAGW